MVKKIGVVVGSLRKESFNRKMAHQLISLSPPPWNYRLLKLVIYLYTTKTLMMKIDRQPLGRSFVSKYKHVKGCSL
ncbi:chromate reductase, Class I, flavoprotein [Legionella sainthelensi]|nr:hypothetical protein [Legionella sainthelensi]VEH27164.1 chromate reductase, Class I, flavoprotein [Legionella sainthelensi]